MTTDARGRSCEVQIRTPEMHAAAEYGLASHWRYKENIEENTEKEENARQNEERRAFIDEQVRRRASRSRGRGGWRTTRARAARRAEAFVDAADADDAASALCELVPCPCPFPTHRPECANHEDNHRMGLGGARARFSNLVSADSASFPGRRDGNGAFFPPSDVVTVVAVVDGRMRVVDVPRGARAVGRGPRGPGRPGKRPGRGVLLGGLRRGEPRACAPGRGGCGDAARGRPRRGDARAPGGGGRRVARRVASGAAAAALGAAAAEEARRRASFGDEMVAANNVVSAKRVLPFDDSCINTLVFIRCTDTDDARA